MLLLRRDYEEEERNVFKPAEWRWTIPQVAMMLVVMVVMMMLLIIFVALMLVQELMVREGSGQFG